MEKQRPIVGDLTCKPTSKSVIISLMRFVILNHQPPTSPNESARTSQAHFDLLFEKVSGEDLKTIAVDELPQVDQQVDFVALPDHRSDYLSYEGEISGGRGSVTRFASGNWNGEFSGDLQLLFENGSANFAGQTWSLRVDCDANTLLRL